MIKNPISEMTILFAKTCVFCCAIKCYVVSPLIGRS